MREYAIREDGLWYMVDGKYPARSVYTPDINVHKVTTCTEEEAIKWWDDWRDANAPAPLEDDDIDEVVEDD